MTASIKHHNPFKMPRMRLHHQQTTATVKMPAKRRRLARDRIQDKRTLPARGRVSVVRVDGTIRITTLVKMNRYSCQVRLALAQAISALMAVLALFNRGILYHTHRLLLSILKWPTMPFRIVIFLLI